MPLHIDKQYADLISSKLDLFGWERDYQARFRCPLCGDSKKKKFKKRGYFISYKDNLWFKCHNCQTSMPFSEFLKMEDSALYGQYMTEVFNYNNNHRWYDKKHNDRQNTVENYFKNRNKYPKSLEKLKSLNELNSMHKCVFYANQRQIPRKHWDNLFYCDNYIKWINEEVKSGTFNIIPEEDPRIVIPFFTNNKKDIIAYQGRTIQENPNEHVLRYITTSLYDGVDIIYGLDRLNKQETSYVFEGPIDSLYIDNSLAVAGSCLKKMINVKNDNFVFVFDNEPRNEVILKLMKYVIDRNKRIVIWPNVIKLKDVGQLIESGMNAEIVTKLLEDNTYQGLKAVLKFTYWKKV